MCRAVFVAFTVIFGVLLSPVPAAEPACHVLFEARPLLFVLKNAASPEKHQIETMTGGVAAFDYDNDGLTDLYFVNGARQPQLDKPDPAWWNRLYRNKGNFEFEDVTERAGVAGAGFGMGAATADFDNDGRVDLFVAGVNRDILYRNLGEGKFEDATERAGLARRTVNGVKPWSVGAAWLDYDHDGDLDLFIVNYVMWNPATEPFCGDTKAGYRTYCHPKYYSGLPNTLFRNDGKGTFTDVTAAAGLLELVGKGMGVAVGDLEGDGWPDLFVGNDTTPNFLLRNTGAGKFADVALRAGVAFNDDGRALSSMGVDFRDVDNDGKPDLFVTALANETFPLFRNLGRGLFADVTYPMKIGAATLAWSGWGAGIYDFDNDGRKDLFAANGDVNNNTEVFSSRKSKQQNMVLVNGGAAFTPCLFGAAAQHRGAAFADFDRDGRVDVAVSTIGEAAVVYRNVTPGAGHWLGVRLVGSKSNRDGLGAEVRVARQVNHATTAVGYASASDRVVHFGLGKATVVDVEVRWPGGAVQRVEKVEADRVVEVREPAQIQ